MRLFTRQGKSDFPELARIFILTPLICAVCLAHQFSLAQQPASRSIWNPHSGQTSQATQTNSGTRYSEGFRPQVPASEYYPPVNQTDSQTNQNDQSSQAGRMNSYGQQSGQQSGQQFGQQAEPFPQQQHSSEVYTASKPQIELISGQVQAVVPQDAPQQLTPPSSAREIPTQKSESPIPLSRNGSNSSETEKTPSRSVGSGSQLALTMIVLLGIVGLILAMAKVLKKHNPLLGAVLPGSVIELLGRRMVDQRHAVHFIRIGERILVIGASQDGLRTLAEITDPVEIDRISGECRTQSAESTLTRSFRMLLSRDQGEQIEQEEQEETVPNHANKASREHFPARKRPEKKRQVEDELPSMFSWETPDHEGDSVITAEDIASLTRTLEAARERRDS